MLKPSYWGNNEQSYCFGEEHIDKAISIFFEDSYLGGDPEVLQYDEYKISVFKSAMPMFDKIQIVKS